MNKLSSVDKFIIFSIFNNSLFYKGLRGYLPQHILYLRPEPQEAETANIKLKDFLVYCNELNFTMDYVANLDSQNRTIDIQKIDSIDKSVLAERLGILEKENHKQAKDIASELGIQKSTYSEYKNSNSSNMIQTLMLKQLAKNYDYSINWLVGRSNQKYIKK